MNEFLSDDYFFMFCPQPSCKNAFVLRVSGINCVPI